MNANQLIGISFYFIIEHFKALRLKGRKSYFWNCLSIESSNKYRTSAFFSELQGKISNPSKNNKSDDDFHLIRIGFPYLSHTSCFVSFHFILRFFFPHLTYHLQIVHLNIQQIHCHTRI